MEKREELLRQLNRCISAIDSLKNELIDLSPMLDETAYINRQITELEEMREVLCINPSELIFKN